MNTKETSGMDEELDPEVAAFLRECDEASGEVSSDDLSGMLSSIEAQVSRSESGTGSWLKSRSTRTRRALAVASFIALSLFAFFAMDGRGLTNLPLWAVGVCLGSLGLMIVLSLWVALRPLQAPALSTGAVTALAALSVGCAVVVAFIPQAAHHSSAGSAGLLASPCMYMGLLIGLPVYALSRVLDRGSRLSSVLAASAAGLTGNFVLALNCPIHDPRHMLLGHASVVVLFIVGVVLVRAVESRLRVQG
ncbi:MAG: DUF1109 domain-containing protein [Deltaproteobacteria bacterium]|nr:DUF1109 domain-containing protein [Deltaproteobacteria bacterium]